MMKALTQEVVKALVSILQESAHYKDQLDLSAFINAGVTEEQIHLIDQTMSTLREHPYLKQPDFEKQYSKRMIKLTLGDLDSFKSLINLDRFNYNDWLAVNGLSADEKLCLPFLVYQYFADEIRHEHMHGVHLNDNLCVELGQKKCNCLTFQCGTQLRIPINEFEMLLMLLLSRFGYYNYFKLDEDNMIVTLRNTGKCINVELRIYATEFSKQADYYVCLIDDRNDIQRKSKRANVVKLEEFSLHHHSNFNADILNAAGLL